MGAEERETAMTVSRQEIDSLKTLADAATEGPWYVGFEDGSGTEDGQIWIQSRDHEDKLGLAATIVTGGEMDGYDAGVHNHTDAAFIAASREAVPRLIADLERARELLEEALLHGKHEGACDNLTSDGEVLDDACELHIAAAQRRGDLIKAYLKDAGVE